MSNNEVSIPSEYIDTLTETYNSLIQMTNLDFETFNIYCCYFQWLIKASMSSDATVNFGKSLLKAKIIYKTPDEENLVNQYLGQIAEQIKQMIDGTPQR